MFITKKKHEAIVTALIRQHFEEVGNLKDYIQQLELYELPINTDQMVENTVNTIGGRLEPINYDED